MGLETSTYINGLVVTNPVATDGLSGADDHLRLIKSTIKNTFPNIAWAITGDAAYFNKGAVPVGTIVMWGKPISAIPAGWSLCNGTNGTPNLTGRFIRHADADASGTVNVGATGGASTDVITTSSNGAHTHTALAGGDHSHGGTTGAHALTASQIPEHSHTYTGSYARNRDTTTSGSLVIQLDGNAQGLSTAQTPVTANGLSLGGGAAHSHTIASSGTHTHTTDSQGAHTHTATVDTLPPFYALAYIMRIAD